MGKRVTVYSQTILLAIILWLVGAECNVLLANAQDPCNCPIENPLGDMGDPSGAESESENDRETDDDNLYEGKSLALAYEACIRCAIANSVYLHESPFSKLTSPPPKLG